MVAKVLNYKEDPKVRSMRVRTWFRSVEMASGLTTRELERLFSDGGAGKAKRSCIWNKYRAGTVAPRSGCSEKGRQNLVERVEKRYPGTAKWLSLPLWRLIDQAPIEMSEIRHFYEGLAPVLRTVFLASGRDALGLFWRRPVDAYDVCDLLKKQGDGDAFFAALVLTREAEITQNQVQHEVACSTALTLLEMFGYRAQPTPLPIKELLTWMEEVSDNAGYFVIPDE